MIKITYAVPGYRSSKWNIGCTVNNTMGAEVGFKILSNKRVLGVLFCVAALDSDGDVVEPLESALSVDEFAVIRCPGPFESYTELRAVNEKLWFSNRNNPIEDVYLYMVRVEYADGTDEVLDEDECVRQQEAALEERRRQKAAASSNNTYNQQKSGCYIATCVYGSYDCPEVWTLRRFRDNTLATTWYGKIFIKVYYAISPKLVKVFGNKGWFRDIWRNRLDKMVTNLQSKGIENTPYSDSK